MKLFNIFSLGVLMACAFSSCEMKKELTSDLEESFEMGALELDVTVKQPCQTVGQNLMFLQMIFL